MASDRIEKLKVKKPDPKPGAAPPAQAGGKKLGAGKPPKGGGKGGKPNPAVKPQAPPECQVVYTCGHKETVGFVQSHPCLACISKRKKENKKRERERYKERQKAGDYTPPDRLPPGSMKQLTWNGVQWVGILEVPGVSGSFAAAAETERQCYHTLHTCYQKYLAENRAGAETQSDKVVAGDSETG